MSAVGLGTMVDRSKFQTQRSSLLVMALRVRTWGPSSRLKRQPPASPPKKNKKVMNGGNFVCLEYFDYTSSNVWIHIMYEYIHSHWLDRLIRVGSSEAQGRRLLARPHRLQPWYWYSLYIRIHIHVYIYMYTLYACLYARMMCFKVVIMIHIFWNSL